MSLLCVWTRLFAQQGWKEGHYYLEGCEEVRYPNTKYNTRGVSLLVNEMAARDEGSSSMSMDMAREATGRLATCWTVRLHNVPTIT